MNNGVKELESCPLTIQLGAGLDPVVCSIIEDGIEITHTTMAGDYNIDAYLWLDERQTKELYDWIGLQFERRT